MAFDMAEVQSKVSRGEALSQEERGTLAAMRDSGDSGGPAAPEGATGTMSTASPESRGGSMSPGAAGLVGRGVSTAASMSGLTGGIPGAAGAVGQVAEGIASGRSAGDIAGRAGTSLGMGLIGSEMAQAGIPSGLVGYGLNTAMNLASEFSKEDPNYGLAVTRSAPSALGSVVGSVLGPIGSMVGGLVGGYFGTQSFKEGYLGDAFDVRSYEHMRDVAEDMGYSLSDTADLAAVDAGYEAMGIDPSDMTTSVTSDDTADLSGGFGLTSAVEDAPLATTTVAPGFWDVSTPVESVSDGEGGMGVSGTASVGDQTAAGFDDAEGMAEAEGMA